MILVNKSENIEKYTFKKHIILHVCLTSSEIL